MSRISELRESESNKVNLVKILELFCDGETKYVEMLTKLFKTSGDDMLIKVNAIRRRTSIDEEKIRSLTENEIEVLYKIVFDTTLMNDLKTFSQFCQYNEQNMIENKDLHSYKTFDTINRSVKETEDKMAMKELEKQITKVFEDKEWLVLIPLTYEASVKYGYNTKWCTAAESTSSQYFSYTSEGVLVYIINKGKSKIAAYKKISTNEISFFNEKDSRIDSIQCKFPSHIMQIVSDTLDKAKKPINDGKLGGKMSKGGYLNPFGIVSHDYLEETLGRIKAPSPYKYGNYLSGQTLNQDVVFSDPDHYLHKTPVESGMDLTIVDYQDRLKPYFDPQDKRPTLDLESSDYLTKVKDIMRLMRK